MNSVTCRIMRGDKELFVSKKCGIAPLIQIIDESTEVEGGEAYDKIVGKAAALLYVLMNIGRVNAEVISQSAIDVLKGYSVPFTYKTLTEKIINRKGDDICPMEKTVENIDTPREAYAALKKKIMEMKG